MEILIGSIVLVFILLAGGTYLASKFSRKNPEEKEEAVREVPSECCGAHEVCEFEELRIKSQEIIYFDDEELDRFKGKTNSDYSDEQIDEIREVLYTLQAGEVGAWLISIEQRGILLPAILQQEARQLIADERNMKNAS